MSILMLSLVITTSLPLESFAITLANGIESTVENESEETDQNKQADGSSENEGVSEADNKDFIGPIQTGESQNANDGPTVETREVPEELKQFFIGEEDLHAMSSYFEQQELADQSDEWQQLKKESMLRSTTYRLSENGRTNANVARYTPSGLHYTHDIIIRWQIDGEDVFCIQEGVFTEAGIQYTQKLDLSSVLTAERAARLSLIGYFGYYQSPTMQNYALTQMMVWAEMGGSFINYGVFGKSTYDDFVSKVNASIADHRLTPSWHNTTVTVKVGEEVRVRDTHNRFASWNGSVIANTAGVNVRKDGNDLVITATAASNDSGRITLAKLNPNGAGIGTTYAYTNGISQDLSRMHLPDPGQGFLNVNVLKQGHARVRKVDETTGEPLAGAVFHFTTDGGEKKEITTNAEGIAEWRDLIHDTKVTIEEITAPNGYVINRTPQTITIRANETTTATFDNRVQLGTITIDKLGEMYGKDMPNDHYTLEGNIFEVFEGSDTNGDLVDTITTNASGTAKTRNLPLGIYTIRERQASRGYVLNTNTWTIEIKYAGQNVEITNVSQEIKNKEQLGTITIDKSAVEFGKDMPNANYTLEGNIFEVYEGSDTSGKLVDTITTNASGIAKSKSLPLGTYTLKEIQASEGFLLNTNTWTVIIKYAGQNIDVTNIMQEVENQEQRGNVVLKKRDIETDGVPQGEATFEGAKFDLYRASNKEKLGTYTTDSKGELTVRNLLLDDYYFVEVEAPKGYVLDDTPVPFTIAYAGQTAAVGVQANVTKQNQVISGGFDLIKIGNYSWWNNAWHWITGQDQSNEVTVLEGVEFTVYRDHGNREEVARKTTDASGHVSFSGLQYGTYRVSETKVPTGYDGSEDFYVTISEHGQTFHYVIENKVKEAKVRFVKVDEETGKEIVRSKAGFEIYSETTGEQLKMKDLDGVEHSVFYTNEEGILQLPTQFAFGEYKAVEVEAPEGYVLADEPAYFEVTGEEEDGIVLVVITNKNQMGQLEVNKTVETNVSVANHESEYGEYSELEFEQHAGAGFEFKIRPTEDIVTGDNTVRFPAGEFLQQDGEDRVWTTDEEGRFLTNPILYIGKYELIEVGAPKGVVLLEDPIPFEIEYAGQAIEITSSTLDVENFLQEINIYGQKEQEVVIGWEDDQAVIDLEAANNGQVFALRLAEELTIGESVLEADTTLRYTTVEDGIIAFEGLKLPNQTIRMYLQEVDAGTDHVLNEAKYFFTYEPETNDQKHDIHVSAKQTENEPETDEEAPIEEGENEDETNDLETEGEAEKQETPETEENEADAGASEESEEQEEDSVVTEEDPEEGSDAILNRLARANVKVIKTDGMDQKALPGVEFDLIRIGEFKQIEPETDNDTTDSENPSDSDEKETEESTPEDEAETTPETRSESAEAEEELPEDKVDEEDNGSSESDSRTVIGTYVTDENGEILVEDLPTGQYVFVETKPLDWYHENNEEYPFEISAENHEETIVIEVENDRLDLEVETVFAETETGAKVVDPTVDNKLTDYAWVRGGKEGHEYFVVTKYINVATQEVVDIEISSFVSKGEEEQELLFDLLLPANTMQDGDELVATHMVYSDEDLTDLVSDHFDLDNKEQTVGFAVNKTPEIPQAGSYSIWDNWKLKVTSFFANLFE